MSFTSRNPVHRRARPPSLPPRVSAAAGKLNAWTAWSPSYTNLTIGNGTVVARAVQIGDKVEAYWSFALGSTSSVGTGPTVSLPVTRSSNYTDSEMLWGPIYLKAGGTQFVGVIRSPSTTTVGILRHIVSGSNTVIGTVDATNPGTWTTGDTMSFTITYEVA